MPSSRILRKENHVTLARLSEPLHVCVAVATGLALELALKRG